MKKANLYITEYIDTYSDIGLAQSKLWSKGTLCITIVANVAESAILGIDACFPDSVAGFIPFENKADLNLQNTYWMNLRYIYNRFPKVLRKIT